MITVKNRQKMRKDLSYGKMKEIAALAQVHPVNVSQWFSGSFNSIKIETAAICVFKKAIQNEKNNKLILDECFSISSKSRSKKELVTA